MRVSREFLRPAASPAQTPGLSRPPRRRVLAVGSAHNRRPTYTLYCIRRPCAQWAAVDDLDLWSEDPSRMNHHAVKTLMSSGLVQAAAQELVRILRDGGGEDARAPPGAREDAPHGAAAAAAVSGFVACLAAREDDALGRD